MKYFITLIWAILLLEMVNFVLNSLNGGGPINLITPIFLAVVMVIVISLLDAAGRPNHDSH